MRPVNLIPSESRPGGGDRSIAGYAIVGLLVFVLVAVSAITLFDKKTNDRQIEADALESQIASAQAEASSYSSFTTFKQVHDARVTTIDSLAKSRFDWERVMQELSVVIPDRVWLTNLTGTVTPAASPANGAGLALRASITGPALEMTGCALNQRTVARLIAAINDIDGVTQVLVSNSAKPAPTTDDAGAPAAAGDGPVTTCAIKPSYPSFELVAAFDDVVPATSDPAVPTAPDAAVPASTDPAAATTTTPETTTTTTTDDGGVAATASENGQQQDETAAAAQNAQDAAQIPSGGGK